MRASNWLLLVALALPACGDDPSQPPATGNPAEDAAVDVAPAADAALPDDASPAEASPEADASQQPYSCPIELALSLQQATVDDLHDLLIAGEALHVVDVREPAETAAGVIEGALLYPWNSGVLKAEHESLPTGDPLYVICRSGSRSLPAATFLVDAGHACVFNVQGGMNAWAAAGYETVIPQ